MGINPHKLAAGMEFWDLIVCNCFNHIFRVKGVTSLLRVLGAVSEVERYVLLFLPSSSFQVPGCAF